MASANETRRLFRQKMITSLVKCLFQLLVEAISSESRFYERTEFRGFEIVGCCAFLEKTRMALELLANSRHFDEIRTHVSVIRQSRRSGMRPSWYRPTFHVGMRTWEAETVWYAGAIAHDAYHSILYRKARRRNRFGLVWERDYGGVEAERKCLGFQLQVLTELGAPGYLLENVKKHMHNPTYQGKPYSLRDYLARDW
jgi:hypothetical protein